MIEKSIPRFAKNTDIEDIIRLCALHAAFEKSDYSKSNKKENLSKHLFSENPSLYCLVIENNTEIIGYATFMQQFSTWDATFYIYMDCLFLTEKCRGYGLGEKLINRIKVEGKKLGCSLIQWQTPDFNTRAMKFYDRIGAVSKSKERYFLKI